MYLLALESDHLYTWSDEYPKGADDRLAKAPENASAPIASAPSHPAWFPDRALQTLWQARMQMRRRPWAWPQVLSVGQLPRFAAANGLRATRGLRPNSGVSGQLSPSPRDLRRDLRDQPRIAAPSGGALKHRHERITGCPPRPARRRTGRRVARQYAGRLARRQSKLFSSSSGGG